MKMRSFYLSIQSLCMKETTATLLSFAREREEHAIEKSACRAILDLVSPPGKVFSEPPWEVHTRTTCDNRR